MRRRRYDVGAIWAVWGSIPVFVFPGMAGHPCPALRAISRSLQGEPPATFAEAHPTGRAVSEEGLGEWDGQTGV